VFVELARTAPAVDLLFLDGDHSYEACLRDWQLYSQLLRPGSLVAFHDIAWAEGVQAVVTGPASAVATRLPGLPNLAVMRYHGGIEP
jgi:predicted O-methyltransferase YrrM